MEELIKCVNEFVKPYKNEGYIEFETYDLRDNLTMDVNVITGGASGGSCWDTAEDEGAVEYRGFTGTIDYYSLIENILNHFYNDDISSEEIYNIMNNVVGEKQDISSYEYYGNYTDKYRVTIDFKKLPEDISFYLSLASQ